MKKIKYGQEKVFLRTSNVRPTTNKPLQETTPTTWSFRKKVNRKSIEFVMFLGSIEFSTNSDQSPILNTAKRYKLIRWFQTVLNFKISINGVTISIIYLSIKRKSFSIHCWIKHKNRLLWCCQNCHRPQVTVNQTIFNSTECVLYFAFPYKSKWGEKTPQLRIDKIFRWIFSKLSSETATFQLYY